MIMIIVILLERRRKLLALYSESGSGSGSEQDSDDTSGDVGATACTENNFPPRLEIFQGISRVKQMPTDITSVSEIVKLFVGNDFLITKRIIFDYNQNQDKFISST
jgi:hypothetical protein